MDLTLATNPFYLIIFYGKSNGMAFQYRSILFKQDFAKSIYKVKNYLENSANLSYVIIQVYLLKVMCFGKKRQI